MNLKVSFRERRNNDNFFKPRRPYENAPDYKETKPKSSYDQKDSVSYGHRKYESKDRRKS